MDGEPQGVALVLDPGHGAELLDDPGEHQCVLLRRGEGEAYVGLAVLGGGQDGHVGDLQSQRVGHRGDSQVADRGLARRPAAAARRRRRPRPPARRPGRRRPASGRPRGTRAGGPGRTARPAPRCGSRVRRWSVSAASSNTRRDGVEVALPHHHAQRLVREVAGRRRRGRSAAGRRRPRCWCRPASRRTARAGDGCPGGTRGRTPSGWCRPRPRCGRPAWWRTSRSRTAGRARRRTSTPGSAPGRPRGRAPRRPRRRPRGAGPPRPAATGLGSPWAKTTRRTPAATSASLHGPVRPVWLHGSSVTTAVVAARVVAGLGQRVGLGVRRPRAAVVALRDGPAVVGQEHAADPGVRAERDAGGRRQLEGARHRRLLGCRDLHAVASPVRSRGSGATARPTCPPSGGTSRTTPACASHPDFDRRSRNLHLVNR